MVLNWHRILSTEGVTQFLALIVADLQSRD